MVAWGPRSGDDVRWFGRVVGRRCSPGSSAHKPSIISGGPPPRCGNRSILHFTPEFFNFPGIHTSELSLILGWITGASTGKNAYEDIFRLELNDSKIFF